MIHNVTVKHYKMADKVGISDSRQVRHFAHKFDITITKRYNKLIQNIKKENNKAMVKWHTFFFRSFISFNSTLNLFIIRS